MQQPHEILKDVLLLEYEKIKDEQRVRINLRENLFYTTIIVIGATFSSLITLSGIDFGYLVLTPILFVISNAYYYNDEIIARMNLFIRENLASRLTKATGLQKGDIFQWESYTRNTRRVRRRLYQLAANFALYPGASAVSLAFFVSRRPALNEAEQTAIIICWLVTALMLIQVIRYADIFSDRR